MIYDVVENLGRYHFISDDLKTIEAYMRGTGTLGPSFTQSRGARTIKAYDGVQVAYSEQLCLHWVSQGQEVIAIGYGEQTRGVPPDGEGCITLDGAQVSVVVTLQAGEFILLMSGEPYACALVGSSVDHISECIRFS